MVSRLQAAQVCSGASTVSSKACAAEALWSCSFMHSQASVWSFAFLNFCCAPFKCICAWKETLDREQLTESRSDWGRDGAGSSYVPAADEAGTPHLLKGCLQRPGSPIHLAWREITTAKGCCLWS